MALPFSRSVIAAVVLAAAVIPCLAGAPMIEVEVDHARIVETAGSAGTVIVGNPAIVDVEVLSSRRLVLTGRSYGITNLVVLDAEGKVMMDEQVAVRTFEKGTVRIYRQASRQTLACAPMCEPTVTIGDEPSAVSDAVAQYNARQSMAVGVATNN